MRLVGFFFLSLFFAFFVVVCGESRILIVYITYTMYYRGSPAVPGEICGSIAAVSGAKYAAQSRSSRLNMRLNRERNKSACCHGVRHPFFCKAGQLAL